MKLEITKKELEFDGEIKGKMDIVCKFCYVNISKATLKPALLLLITYFYQCKSNFRICITM